MTTVAATLNRYSKFIAAIIGAITEAVNLGYVPHVAQNYVSMAVTILTALGVVGVSNGPALADGTAIANDLASLKEQIGPLPAKGGLVSVTKHLAQIAEQHGKNLEAIVEAAKVDIQDLLHQPAVSAAKQPVTIGGSMLAINQVPVAAPEVPVTTPDVTVTPVSEAPTPVAEPASQSQLDAVAELATLVP